MPLSKVGTDPPTCPITKKLELGQPTEKSLLLFLDDASSSSRDYSVVVK